jgi:hypothetical protein
LRAPLDAQLDPAQARDDDDEQHDLEHVEAATAP